MHDPAALFAEIEKHYKKCNITCVPKLSDAASSQVVCEERSLANAYILSMTSKKIYVTGLSYCVQ